MTKYILISLLVIIVGGIFFLNSLVPKGFDYSNLNLEQNLQNSGLEKLSMEGNVLHIHQHMDIFIKDKKVVIPEGIGIGPGKKYFSPIHVHDTTGIIHVESPILKNFTLGQFFQIWGIQFNDQCIGIYCNDDKNKLKVYVNGDLVKTGVQNINLTAHQEIAIYFGLEVPADKIIKNYNFPSNL